MEDKLTPTENNALKWVELTSRIPEVNPICCLSCRMIAMLTK